jgi:hypothetical protein
MYLADILGVGTADQIDPTRPLVLGPLELGAEAAAEAARILGNGEFCRDVQLRARSIKHPFYWALAHHSGGTAEIFAFPEKLEEKLPTAIEVALVRAIAAAAPESHQGILAGGIEVALGAYEVHEQFRNLIAVADTPMIGDSLLCRGATQAILDENIKDLLTNVVIKCLANSLRTSPIKFRFLELYRVMEARFLAEIRNTLISKFDAEPGAALGQATSALKSELTQITGLASTQQDSFEACWTALHSMKDTNRFVAALFRRLDEKKVRGPKWEIGAALIYQIRCAVVHAGGKDMIFENFNDGDAALTEILPFVERAALRLVGVELL